MQVSKNSSLPYFNYEILNIFLCNSYKKKSNIAHISHTRRKTRISRLQQLDVYIIYLSYKFQKIILCRILIM